jgi:hypothetical protein
MLITNALLCCLALCQGPGEANRAALAATPEYRADSHLSAELVSALRRVHAVEARLLELRLFNTSGRLVTKVPPADSPAMVALAKGEPGLIPALERFDLGATDGASITVSLGQVVESAIYDAAHGAAAAAFAAEPSLGPTQLLEALRHEFLSAAPVNPDERAQRFHASATNQERLGPLCNGSIAYVIWGFLYLPEFWRERPEERAEFISAVIEAGVQSPVCAWAARRVLQPPLRRTLPEHAHGVAMELERLRDVVGFTADHERLLLELVRAAEAARARARNPAPPPPLPTPQPAAQEANTPREPTLAVEAPLPHLGPWAAELLYWVQRELHPNRLNLLMRRSELLENRLAYWTELAETMPFAVLREEFLAELQAIVAGEDDYPGSARIAELEALQLGVGLDPAQESELKRLRRDRMLGRRDLISHIGVLSITSGFNDQYAAVAELLGAEAPALLALSEYGNLPSGPLDFSYMHFSAQEHPESLLVLEGHLSGDGPKLQWDLSTRLVTALSSHKLPGHEPLLERALELGSPEERMAALGDSGWCSAERYGQAISRVIDDLDKGAVSQWGQGLVASQLLSSLHARGAQEALPLLRESIRRGLWANPKAPNCLATGGAEDVQWCLAQLSSEEKQNYVQNGLLPAHLAK